MLVLSRYEEESVVIGDGEIIVTVVKVRGDKVRLGITAPKNVGVYRHELWDVLKNAPKKKKNKETTEAKASVE
jgi:carbon storage regulator